MTGLIFTSLSALFAILTLSVTETEADDVVKCYGRISAVNIRLKCDDRYDIITTITQFNYSRREGRSSKCDQDSKEYKCSFDLKNRAYVRNLCLGKRECKVHIYPESTGTTSRTQRGQRHTCRPNFNGHVIVHVRYKCEKQEQEDEHNTTTEKTIKGTRPTRPPKTSPTTSRTTSPTTSRRMSVVRKSSRQSSTKRVTLPVDIGDATTVTTRVMDRTIREGKVGQQGSKDPAKGGTTNTGLIVGSVVGVIVLSVGVAIAFIHFRRHRDGDLEMRPATISTRKTENSYDGLYVTTGYTADHVYEDAPSVGNVYEDLTDSQHRTMPTETQPPVPSRTPSNELTVSRTTSNVAPPPVPSRSPNTDEEHQYLELISDHTGVASP